MVCMALTGCAAKKPATQTPSPSPEIANPKPKLRPINPGDIVLQQAEIRDDGTVVCHHPAQLLDAKKPREPVTYYRCR